MSDRNALRALQWRKLSAGLAHALPANRFLARRLPAAGLPAEPDWDFFRRLPLTTKADLLDDQAAAPPYGTNLSRPLPAYTRLHQSWRWLTDELWPALFGAMGIGAGDRLLFPFSFGPFLGFWAGFEGAQRLGALTIAAGGMTSSARLQLIAEHAVTVVCCTPTYALRLAEVAAAEGFDLPRSTVRALLLAGEPGGSIAATRQRLETAWGARVFDHSGMTEIGALGVEFAGAPGRLHLLEDHCIAEFLDPATGAATAEGELGELVLTNLGRWDAPLLRYRTGDLVRWRLSAPPAGAPWPYVHLEGGILARADDMLWIKGNNVYPSAVEAVLRVLPWVREFRLEVSGAGASAALRLLVEAFPATAPADAAAQVARAVQDRLYFRPDVTLMPVDSLSAAELKSQRIVRL
jgi:phenylacetate-CoA ligase